MTDVDFSMSQAAPFYNTAMRNADYTENIACTQDERMKKIIQESLCGITRHIISKLQPTGTLFLKFIHKNFTTPCFKFC